MSKGMTPTLVALVLLAFAGGAGRPAFAQVSGTLNQWTATAMIERIEGGAVQVLVAFDDNGSGGARRGGIL